MYNVPVCSDEYGGRYTVDKLREDKCRNKMMILNHFHGLGRYG